MLIRRTNDQVRQGELHLNFNLPVVGDPLQQPSIFMVNCRITRALNKFSVANKKFSFVDDNIITISHVINAVAVNCDYQVKIESRIQVTQVLSMV